MNLVILMGNVGTDPEVKVFDNKKRTSFKLATNQSYKNKDGKTEKITMWHNVVAWSGRADLIEKYLNKGMKVLVRGWIKYDKFERDGNTVYSTSIVMDSVQFLSKKSSEVPETNQQNEDIEDFNLPF